MANCCTGEKCKKILTVKDIESIIDHAEFIDCTNYESGGSVNHSGCCNATYEEYSPNFNELTQNTSADTIWFQNWEEGSTGYDDLDGIYVTDPNWDSNDCCSGVANVSLENVKFKYSNFKSFAVNGNISVNSCYTGNSSSPASFTYSVERHEVDGCELVDTKVGEVTIGSSSDSRLWGEVISAVSVGNASSWRDYDSFNSVTVGDIEINKSNIFSPIFSNNNLSVNYSNCDGLTATSDASNVTVYIMPKFRGCTKSYDYYTVSKSGLNGSFTWDVTGNCGSESAYFTKEGTTLTVGSYSGDIGEPSITLSKDSGKDIDNITANASGGYVTLVVGKNSDSKYRGFTITVKFTICGQDYSTSCSFCQEKGINIIPIPGNCCNGFVSSVPPITCGDSFS